MTFQRREGATIIFLCDDPLCSGEAVARALVVDRRGRTVKSCNVCQKHLDALRAADHAGGKYRLRETAPCERTGA